MRHHEHHMASAEVCDAQEPPRSTFFGRDIDATTSPTKRAGVVCITVIPLCRLTTTLARRPCGTVSTTWHQLMCVMPRSRLLFRAFRPFRFHTSSIHAPGPSGTSRRPSIVADLHIGHVDATPPVSILRNKGSDERSLGTLRRFEGVLRCA